MQDIRHTQSLSKCKYLIAAVFYNEGKQTLTEPSMPSVVTHASSSRVKNPRPGADQAMNTCAAVFRAVAPFRGICKHRPTAHGRPVLFLLSEAKFIVPAMAKPPTDWLEQVASRKVFR